MASVGGIATIILGLTHRLSSKWCGLVVTHKLNFQSCAAISVGGSYASLLFKRRSDFDDVRMLKSVQVDVFLTSDEEDEMGEGFFKEIEELGRMAREPSDVLEEMNERLSARELQLVLVYFAQEERDSWCVLEVFEWLKKKNRMDKETMELVVSIMCTWVKTNFSMIEKVVSLYWEVGEKEEALLFVKEVLMRRISSLDANKEGNKGGPAGYLAWKMMGNYKDDVKLVIHLRECGLKPEIYSYLIAMTTVVKELNEFANTLRELKAFTKSGMAAELDTENLQLR